MKLNKINTKNAMKATKMLELPPSGDCAFADNPASEGRAGNFLKTISYFCNN